MNDIIEKRITESLPRIAEAKESITDPQLLAALEALEQVYKGLLSD